MVTVANIEFAPIDVPWDRRMQTMAVLHYVFLMCFSFFFLPLMCYIFLPWIWPLAIAYILWIVVYDYGRSSRGGRRSEYIRNLPLHRRLAEYFPVNLIKTTDLDPGRNYIFGYHPHGIISIGAYANFATEGTNFSEKFPGITPYLCTLYQNFWIPLRREYIMLHGCVDVSKQSIAYLLTKLGKGNAVTIVIGGAAEALEAHPGKYVLTLAHRKGFVRMAIKYGADLVPVFSFGENDLYLQSDNPEGSFIRDIQLQEKLKCLAGFSLPMFHGRGVFTYNLGLLPFRKPINTVVGAPIRVDQCKEFTPEMVDKLHKCYTDALSDLFERHKVQYGVSAETKLTFV